MKIPGVELRLAIGMISITLKDRERFFRGIEWHCGFQYNKYFKVYLSFFFPPSYVETGSVKGVCFTGSALLIQPPVNEL